MKTYTNIMKANRNESVNKEPITITGLGTWGIKNRVAKLIGMKLTRGTKGAQFFYAIYDGMNSDEIIEYKSVVFMFRKAKLEASELTLDYINETKTVDVMSDKFFLENGDVSRIEPFKDHQVPGDLHKYIL